MDVNISIICGDAVEELKKIPSESVDLIATDPPYNLGKDYGNNSDALEYDDFFAFSRGWLTEAKRVLAGDGTIYVFMGVRHISHVYDILERELGMAFNSWITWHYTQGIGKTRGFSPRHDDILMFTKSSAKFTFNLDDVRVPQKAYRARNNMEGANPGNVWEFSHVHFCNRDRTSHPTQKPEALFERMILASSNPGDTVLDPFVGSGTSLRVCQQLGRHGIGIDVNPEYAEMTRERLAKPFTGFDSIDKRMLRVPDGLNDAALLEDYVKKHADRLMKTHPGTVGDFLKEVERKYNYKIEYGRIFE
ncbi:MAG: site-specific DNA-methyltransferase [Clostridia bacterium]|nr:site-specific DNA-methyltransferase [Clostridia bacterium]